LVALPDAMSDAVRVNGNKESIPFEWQPQDTAVGAAVGQ